MAIKKEPAWVSQGSILGHLFSRSTVLNFVGDCEIVIITYAVILMFIISGTIALLRVFDRHLRLSTPANLLL